MSTDIYTQTEQAVLEAAQKLVDRRNSRIGTMQSAEALRQELQNLLAEQQFFEGRNLDSERELAYNQLDAASKTLRESENRRFELLQLLGEARTKLWSACFSGDKALILRTAREYGDCLTSHLTLCTRIEQNRVAHEEASSNLGAINQTAREIFLRIEAVKKQQKTVRANLSRIESAPIVQDNLERDVTNAAALLCGSEDIVFAVPGAMDWQRLIEGQSAYLISYASGQAEKEDTVTTDNNHANS